MMAYIRERDSKNTESFSFLYLANVLGAMSGTFLTAIVLVELVGFRHTLWVAAAGNFTIAVIGGCLGWKQRGFVAMALTEAERSAGPGNLPSSGNSRRRFIKWILFSTGFVRDGHGGGVDAGVHAGFENAGVFVCADRVHVSGGDFPGFMAVSARSQK